MKTVPQALGIQGEALAARYLEQRDLKVVDRHFQTRWGEIDLICKDKDTLVFVEVKARTHASRPSAAEMVTPSKQKKIVGAALSYVKKHGLKDHNIRFDVVTIEGDHLEWIPGAFEPAFPYTY